MQALINVLFCIVVMGGTAALLLIGLGVAKLVRWLRNIHDNVDEHAEKPNPL